VTPALSWSAFDIGSHARDCAARNSDTRGRALYEQSVLRGSGRDGRRICQLHEQQERLVKLNDQARESARASSDRPARYREGVAIFLALLDAERTQLQAERLGGAGGVTVFTSVVASPSRWRISGDR